MHAHSHTVNHTHARRVQGFSMFDVFVSASSADTGKMAASRKVGRGPGVCVSVCEREHTNSAQVVQAY